MATSILHRKEKVCGRLATKPVAEKEHEQEDHDAELPLQQQIDNLRAKISLKKRYNKAFLEEVTEKHSGATKMIEDLLVENESLFRERNEAMHAGHMVVSKGLRNDRLFLLAMRGKQPDCVMAWLDDQLSDQRRILDEKVYIIRLLQKKLEDAERHVEDLEKWPYPGTTPWEKKVIHEFTELYTNIAERTALADCASSLNVKYKYIKMKLGDEKDGWPHALQDFQNQYKEIKKELDSLQMMLDDAVQLKNVSGARLQITEKEYSENRRDRAHRINKIRKLCEQEMHTRRRNLREKVGKQMDRPSVLGPEVVQSHPDTIDALKSRRAAAKHFEDKARVLVEAMRVPDLRFCPARIHTVTHLGKVLHAEVEKRKEYLTVLGKTKANLILIKNYLMYTGCEKTEKYDADVKELLDKITNTENEENTVHMKADKIGNALNTCRKGLIGMNEIFHTKKDPKRKNPTDFMELAKIVLGKINTLVQEVDSLQQLFPSESDRNYSLFVRFAPLVRKGACRLGAIYHNDSSDTELSDDEEAGVGVVNLAVGGTGDRVLGRSEMKMRNLKIYNQGVLQRGLKESAIRRHSLRLRQISE